MNDSFSRIDFVLVPEPLDQVLAVLAKRAYDEDSAPPEPVVPWKPSFGMRLMAKLTKAPIDEMVEMSKVEPGEPLPPRMLHRGVAADLNRFIEGEDESLDDDVRMSSVAANPDWTLVEYREMIGGWSSMAFNLSTLFPDAEVFYLRRTGSTAKAPAFDFHVHRGGEQKRRVMSVYNIPLKGDPEWEGHFDGEPHEVEDEGLHDGATEETAMTAAKQDYLLERLGLSMELLFGSGARKYSVLMSRKPGGEGLERFANVEVPDDPYADIEVRPVGPMEMLGEIARGVREAAKGTAEEERVEGELGKIEQMAEKMEHAMAAEREPVAVYGTKTDAIRDLTRLLLQCDITPDDADFWVGRLIDGLDDADWENTYDELADFVVVAPVASEERRAMMMRVEGILERLSV